MLYLQSAMFNLAYPAYPRCHVAAVASSKWMLHTGGGSGETPPHMIVKRFGCTTIHKKALYKCIIHSFIQDELFRLHSVLREH